MLLEKRFGRLTDQVCDMCEFLVDDFKTLSVGRIHIARIERGSPVLIEEISQNLPGGTEENEDVPNTGVVRYFWTNLLGDARPNPCPEDVMGSGSCLVLGSLSTRNFKKQGCRCHGD
jgi:hypothetical protein